MSEMQKLTDHTLDYDKNGYVYIAQNAYDHPIFGNLSPGSNPYFGVDLFSKMYLCKKYNNIKYIQGNMLIERMINSQKNCSITVDYDYAGGLTDFVSSKNCSNGKGTDTSIIFNPDFSPYLYTGKTVNSLLSLQKTDPYIVLAHEMIHADRAMQGITLTGKTSHKYLISYSSNSLFSNETYGYEPIKKEEAATVGFGYCNINSTTENMIREEHGLPMRGRYTVDQ